MRSTKTNYCYNKYEFDSNTNINTDNYDIDYDIYYDIYYDKELPRILQLRRRFRTTGRCSFGRKMICSCKMRLCCKNVNKIVKSLFIALTETRFC